MRASDWRISLSQVDSDVVPSGDLHPMTFIACGVDRSIGGGSMSWQTMSSWMNLPRLTIDVFAGSDADHRKLGCVSMPDAPLRRRPGRRPRTSCCWRARRPRTSRPGYSVARRLFRKTFCDVTRSFTVPPLVHSTSFTNCCVDGVEVGRQSRSDRGRPSASAESSAVSLFPLSNICRTLNQSMMMLVRFAFDGGQREQAIDLGVEPGGGGEAAVGRRRRQRGVGQRAEEQEAELAGDLVRR